MPVPAFLFVYASGLLERKGRAITYLFCVLQLGLVLAIFLGAPLHRLDKLNSIFVIATLITLVILSFRLPSRRRDFLVIRIGLLIFVAFAIGTNAAEILGFHTSVESYGFAIFLGCLGYVAAQRSLERDQQLRSIQQELDIAQRIQTSILPSAFPSSQHFRVAARYVPMTSVAGDFYDFLVSSDGKAGLLIADVSGHGVPAALIASMVKIAATSQRVHAAHPAKLLDGMNDTLCGNTQNQFVTAAYLHLDAHTGTLRYSAAAHPPLLLLRDGNATALEENGLMLAPLFPSATYTTAEQPLRPGDRFVLYTDGIVEAANAREEEFGHERLCALLQSSAGRSHAETADLIISAVQDWSAAQEDDLTVLVCDYIACV